MMTQFIFSQKGFNAFLELINITEMKLDEVSKNKSEAGAGSDGWHDEGFKIGIGEEMTWVKRLAELQKILSHALIVEPKEQNEIVKFGNGVIIEYSNGKDFKFILEGYMVSNFNMNRAVVSIYSPLGQDILNAKVGETRTLKAGSTVKVKKIFLPSKAEDVFE